MLQDERSYENIKDKIRFDFLKYTQDLEDLDLAIQPVILCKTIQRKWPISNLNKHTLFPMKNVDCRSLMFVLNNIQQLNFPTLFLSYRYKPISSNVCNQAKHPHQPSLSSC